MLWVLLIGATAFAIGNAGAFESEIAAPAPAAVPPVAVEENAPEGAAWATLSAEYPNFVAGLQDCLDHLILGEAAQLDQRGEKMGNDPISFAIFYPEMKQPFDFITSISSSGGVYSCSGQGPTSIPTDQMEAQAGALAALYASRGLRELNFPAPARAFADCDNDIGVVMNDAAGFQVFAGFAGQNATTYCTSFGVKE